MLLESTVKFCKVKSVNIWVQKLISSHTVTMDDNPLSHNEGFGTDFVF